MAGVPIVYRDRRERILANYDYTDIAAGSGYVKYFLFAEEDENGFNYHIQEKAKWSSKTTLAHSLGASGDESTEFITGTFKRSQVIEGIALFNCTFNFKGSFGGPNHGKMSIELYHYDGSTSTQIGNTWTSETLSETQGDDESIIIMAQINCPKTNFKMGDQLKIKIISTYSGSDVGSFEYGISPQNRDGSRIKPSTSSNVTTVFNTEIPFKIDL